MIGHRGHLCEGAGGGGAQRKSPVQLVKERLEPSVPASTIVNDGSIFVVLGAWCAPPPPPPPLTPRTPHILRCAWRRCLSCPALAAETAAEEPLFSSTRSWSAACCGSAVPSAPAGCGPAVPQQAPRVGGGGGARCWATEPSAAVVTRATEQQAAGKRAVVATGPLKPDSSCRIHLYITLEKCRVTDHHFDQCKVAQWHFEE